MTVAVVTITLSYSLSHCHIVTAYWKMSVRNSKVGVGGDSGLDSRVELVMVGDDLAMVGDDLAMVGDDLEKVGDGWRRLPKQPSRIDKQQSCSVFSLTSNERLSCNNSAPVPLQCSL